MTDDLMTEADYLGIVTKATERQRAAEEAADALLTMWDVPYPDHAEVRAAVEKWKAVR